MASLSTDEERKRENTTTNFDCAICLEKLTNPRCLPCLHTYCESCLNSYIISHISDTEPVTFPCPSCRREIESPQKGVATEKWASTFPINNWIMPSMEASAVSQPFDQDEGFCEPCKRENEHSLALLWCIQCREGLCEMCNKFHRRMKFSDGHEVVKMKEKEQLKLQVFSSPELFCKHHQGEALENYCIDHQYACCKLCLISEHRFCQNIRTIAEISNDVKTKLCKETLSGELDSMARQAESLIQPFVLSVSLLDHNSGIIKEEISQKVAKVKSNLDECHLEFNEKLDSLRETKTLFFKEQIQVVKQFLEVVSDCQKMLTNSTTNEKESKELFLIAKHIRSKLLHTFVQLQAAMNANMFYVDLKLKLDDTFEQLMKTLTIGEVSLVETPKGVFNISLLKDIETFPVDLRETPCIEQITMDKVLEIKQDNYYFCSEGVFMKDRTMIFISDNKMLIVFDALGRVKFTHSVDYSPRDIAANAEGKMAFVSDSKSYKIRSYSQTDTHLIEMNSFEVQEKEKGFFSADVHIATTHDTLICGIGTYRDEKILLMDLSGHLLKQLKTRFENMCASVTDKKLYYTWERTVVCQNLNGKEIFRYSHPDLCSPKGIALDLYGNIYVCGIGEGKLHLISKDGKRGKSICIPGLEINPRWIGFDFTGRHLFVSHPGRPIEKYQLNFV